MPLCSHFQCLRRHLRCLLLVQGMHRRPRVEKLLRRTGQAATPCCSRTLVRVLLPLPTTPRRGLYPRPVSLQSQCAEAHHLFLGRLARGKRKRLFQAKSSLDNVVSRSRKSLLPKLPFPNAPPPLGSRPNWMSNALKLQRGLLQAQTPSQQALRCATSSTTTTTTIFPRCPEP